MKGLFLVLILGLGIFFCTCKYSKKEFHENKPDSLLKAKLEMPQFPGNLHEKRVTEEERIWGAIHYWDHFDFSDSTHVHSPEVMERAAVNYMRLLQAIPAVEASNSLKNLCRRMAGQPRMIQCLLEIFTQYWYDPYSPMKDESMFILLCKSVEETENIKPYLRKHARYLRNLAEKNRVGTRAGDIVYTLDSGKQGYLYDLNFPYTLVFFYNPDCHTCAVIREVMCKSSLLKLLQEDNQLKILAIYPDEDIALWREHLPEMPKQWINSYDKDQLLSKNDIYYLSSIPSFYLLDKDKIVLLKDADWMQVIRFLESSYNQ